MVSAIRIGLLLLGLLGGAALAAPEPDAAHRLLAAARQAMGGGAWDRVETLHERFGLAAGGLEGAAELWAGPGSGRAAERYALGPDRGGAGWDGAGGWVQDWAGRVHRAAEEALAEQRADALWQSFAFLEPDRNGVTLRAIGRRTDEAGQVFEAVQLTQAGAAPLELWLDQHSSLPARVIRRSRSGLGESGLIVRFDEYRPVRGLLLPGTIRSATGAVGAESVMTLIDAEENPPPAVDPFKAPPSAPPDYRFTGSLARTRVSLVPTGDSFLVDVAIDGKGPYRFALDTGAGNALDTGLAAELGLPVAGALTASGAGEAPVAIGLTRAGKVELGDVALTDQLFRVLPLTHIAGDRPAYRGLLGAEFFDRFVVAIDPDRRAVVIEEPSGWHYRGDEAPVTLHFHGATPAVDGTIDLVPGRFTLDTGQANSLTLYRPFLQRMGITRKYEAKLSAIVAEGVGGPIRADVARGHALLLGGTLVTSPVLFLSQQKSGAFSDPDLAGNVGDGVFSRFRTIFDYARREVFFEPIPGLDQGDSLKLMVVKRGTVGLQVLSVLPGCPLAEAGLKRDDVIQAIDYRDVASIDEPMLERIFRRPPGTKVAMTIRSDGQLKFITVVLGGLV